MKKAISLMLAIMIFAGTLAGCKPQEQDSQSKSSSKTTSSSVNTAKDESEKELEPATIKIYNLGSTNSGNQEVYDLINEKFKADINATVDFEWMDWSDWATKYPLLFAAQEDFDAIYTSNWAFYGDQAKKGGFMELTTEMIQKYAPHNFETVTQDQWTQTKVNGKTYMLPMTYKAVNALVYLIRGDLRKKYGLAEIKTEADLITYWEAVVKNEKGILPIALGNTGDDFGRYPIQTFLDVPYEKFSTNYMFTLFDSYPLCDVDTTDPANVKLIDPSEYLIAVYKKLQSCQKKGFWSKNALNQTDSSATMMENGKSASTIHAMSTMNGLYTTLMESHPDWEPEIVDIVLDRPVQANPATNNGVAVNAKSKNPERTLMVLDRLGYDQEYYDLSHNGIKGVHWDSTGTTDITILKVPESRSYNSYGMPFTTNLERINNIGAPNYKQYMEKYYSNCFTPTISMMNFDKSSVVNECAAIDGIKAKYLPILRLGFTDDVDKTFADFKNELKAAGLEKVQAEYLIQAQAFMDSYGK